MEGNRQAGYTVLGIISKHTIRFFLNLCHRSFINMLPGTTALLEIFTVAIKNKIKSSRLSYFGKTMGRQKFVRSLHCYGKKFNEFLEFTG